MKILIIEDDKTLNNGIALSLGSDTVLQAYCLAESRALLDNSIDLVILDSNLPVIILTANDMEIDIVTGLETGADDYITKPFSLAVLRARVNAVLRRRSKGNDLFRTEQYEFDFDNMKFLVDGRPVELSKTEQRLLKLFVQNPGRTLPRAMLLDRVWTDNAEFVEENALSVAVKRLRQKIADIPIKSVYGIGYVWELQKGKE